MLETSLVLFQIALAALGLIVVFLVSGFKRVSQYQIGLVERFNAFEKEVEPGLRFIIPGIQRLLRVNMREQVIDVPPQEIITKDNVVVIIDAVVFYEVVKAQLAIYEVEDFEMAIVKLAQTTLRDIVGEMDLDTCLTARKTINDRLRAILDEATDKWGTKVTRIEVQRIDPPKDIVEAMHKQKTAEQERRSMALIATGRKEAADQDKEAAIRLAEGKKQASILEAEGASRAIELVATASAKKIELEARAAEKYFTDRAQLNKRLDVVRDTFKPTDKLVVPADADVLVVSGVGGEIPKVIPVAKEAANKTEMPKEGDK